MEKFHELPKCLAASLAFYKSVRLEKAGLIGVRGENEYTIQDGRAVLEFYAAHKDDGSAACAHAVLGNEAFWGRDLTAVSGLEAAVAGYLAQIETEGAYAVMKSLL